MRETHLLDNGAWIITTRFRNDYNTCNNITNYQFAYVSKVDAESKEEKNGGGTKYKALLLVLAVE